MRKPKTYYATRGHLTASGASKSEAKANLESMVDWACSPSQPVIESRYGLLLIVAASPGGYLTAVINPAEMKHGERRVSWCQHPQGDYSFALESVRHHAAQMAWDGTCTADNDSVFVEMAGLTPDKARELARWIQSRATLARLLPTRQRCRAAGNRATPGKAAKAFGH